MASARIVSCIGPCCATAVWTETTGGSSAACFEQAVRPVRLTSHKPIILLLRRGMNSKAPGQSLQVGNCHAISHLPIVVAVAGLDEHILSIDCLKRSGFSALVTNIG